MTAGTWMDEVRSDKTYDFTKSWNYINISKGLNYAATTDENIVNEILVGFEKRNESSGGAKTHRITFEYNHKNQKGWNAAIKIF
jgi:hypothetical protein